MNKKLFTSLALGVLLSGLALYLAFRNVPIEQLLHYLGTINYWLSLMQISEPTRRS
jgi:hypothetical protein